MLAENMYVLMKNKGNDLKLLKGNVNSDERAIW